MEAERQDDQRGRGCLGNVSGIPGDACCDKESRQNMKLHIYGQQLNHDAAWLVGDKQALYELRDAVDRAIQDGNTCLDFEAQDGEGYSLYIAEVETKDMTWEQLDLPYTDRS